MAEVWEGVSNAAYHTDMEKQGSTMLKCILESPAEYYQRFVGKKPDGTPLMVKEPTKNMILGSAVHALVLEPDNFDKLFCCRPEGIDGRTTDGKKALAAFRLISVGKLELTAEMHEQAKAMANAVLSEPEVYDVMEHSIKERAIIWEEDGIWFKCKPDIYLPRPNHPTDVHLDLKTSDDPSPEAWMNTSAWGPMRKWGYDLQVSAHYPDGIEALTSKPCLSGVIVVGSAEPHDVYVYDTTSHRDCGEAWRQKAIRLLRMCRESGVWRRPEQDHATTLPPPSDWNFPPQE